MPMIVNGIYRYPVKGFSGEELPQADLQPGQTIAGDRMFALGRPGLAFDVTNPVWMPKTNFLALVRDARLAELRTRYDDSSGLLSVGSGDEELLTVDLSHAAGRAELEAFLADFLSDEISGSPTVLRADGHSFSDLDAKVVSLINMDTVRALDRHTGTNTHPLRFRANLYFDGAPAWSELDWVGREITIGTASLQVIKRTRRCAATNVNPETALRDMNIPAVLQRNWGHSDLGIYARVIDAGTIRAGDQLRLRD